MERRASWMCSVFYIHLSLMPGAAVRLGAGHNHSKPYEKTALPCKKEQLQCGNGPCLMNWLRCRYKKDCGKDNVSITVACSEIHLNKTSPINVFTHYTAVIGCESMPDSSVLVAGVVIGLVLFLSCVAIIVGSLRKKQCFRHLQLQRDVSYTPDCFSYGGGSIGELRPSCIEEFPPAFYFSSYMEMLSQANITHPDSPPRYDECVGPEATQIYIPTDDPPPYSLIDPCQQNDNVVWRGGGGGEMAPGTSTEWDAGHLLRFEDLSQPIPSISLSSSFPMEAAPPYETVVREQTITLPLAQLHVLKNSTDHYQTSSNRIS